MIGPCMYLFLLGSIHLLTLGAPRSSKKGGDDGDRNQRIAIVNGEKCKPKKCRQECKKGCPVVRMGKLCIEVRCWTRIPTDSLAYVRIALSETGILRRSLPRTRLRSCQRFSALAAVFA